VTISLDDTNKSKIGLVNQANTSMEVLDRRTVLSVPAYGETRHFAKIELKSFWRCCSIPQPLPAPRQDGNISGCKISRIEGDDHAMISTVQSANDILPQLGAKEVHGETKIHLLNYICRS